MKTILFILILLPFIGWGQKDSTIVFYTDFKGIPPKDELCVAARTYTNLSMEYGPTETSKFEIKVWASFVSEKSWLRIITPETISHETCHWRIALLMAAKCNKKLDPYRDNPNPNMNKIDSIFYHYQKQIDLVNAKFDKESTHSNNKEAEERWERYIYLELKQYQ